MVRCDLSMTFYRGQGFLLCQKYQFDYTENYNKTKKSNNNPVKEIYSHKFTINFPTSSICSILKMYKKNIRKKLNLRQNITLAQILPSGYLLEWLTMHASYIIQTHKCMTI